MRIFLFAGTMVSVLFSTSGCSTMGPTRANLSAEQVPSPSTEKAFINVLMEPIYTCPKAVDKDDKCLSKDEPDEKQIKRYLTAGFGLTDIYCDTFFRNINLSHRSRKFSRSLTNDAGTLIQSVLGLTSVGKGVITGVGAAFGSADSSWRNYDDAYMVSPNLDVVRTMVLTAQDDFRVSTYTKSMPNDYPTARSAIIRYAGFCSFLGMQSLLNKSIEHQTEALKISAEKKSEKKKAVEPDSTKTDGESVSTPQRIITDEHQNVSSSVVPNS